MKSSSLGLVIAFAVFLSACSGATSIESILTDAPAASEADATSAAMPMGGGQGMGPGNSMMARHSATIPPEYAGLTNPIAADEESLARGAEAYATCAVCHGDGGLGDGAAGASLVPAPANIAHTSQMMGDDYLFWRISEGGAQFETSMPAWGLVFDEQTRWDLINVVQALGAGTVVPGGGMGGPGFNAQAQAVQQAALLEIAVAQGVIAQDEADAFVTIHPIVDARMAAVRGTMLTDVLTELVASGGLTQGQADTFLSVHDRLSQAGLLP